MLFAGFVFKSFSETLDFLYAYILFYQLHGKTFGNTKLSLVYQLRQGFEISKTPSGDDAFDLVDRVRAVWNPLLVEMKEWYVFGKDEERLMISAS